MIKFLLLIFIISCATKSKLTIKVDTTKTNSKISKLLKEFKIKSSTPIIFRNVDKKYVAVCKRYKDKSLNVIYINKKEWSKTSKAQKKLVLIHEIGHCDKNLDHNNKLLKDGCPSSIMYSTLFSSSCFVKYENKYYTEVFGR